MRTQLLSLLFLASTAVAAADLTLKDYWTVEEYFALHPEQQARFDTFNRGVRNVAAFDVPPPKDVVKISVVYPGEQASDYWRRSVDSFKARLNEIGISYELDAVFTKPGTELIKQSQLIQASVADDTDYLIFTLDALRHKALVEQIVAKGKPKMILQNITTPLKDLGDNQPFMYVGFDHQLGTQLLVEKYLSVFPEGGRFALLYGTKGYVSTMRGDTFTASMNQANYFDLVASYYVNFNRERAYKATKNLFETQDDIQFIYAASTDIALGAIDYLTEVGLKESVTVNGWGGGSAELASIQEGVLDFTVMRMNDDNGVAMADAIYYDLIGDREKVPLIYSGDFLLIDSSLNEERLNAAKVRAFRYSGE